MLFRRTLSLAVALVFSSLCCSAMAEDRDLAFVHALQSRHYGDTAVEFLQAAKSSPDASAEIRDLWDLEMSKSLREQAQAISDFQARDKLLKDAQSYLNVFAKEKPNHPEALQAQLTNAGMILD